jgi:hypothetical protein
LELLAKHCTEGLLRKIDRVTHDSCLIDSLGFDIAKANPVKPKIELRHFVRQLYLG